jgi:hypothetical protein
MRNNEPYEQLVIRLDSYPRKLGNYFKNILKGIDPIYTEVSAQIFLLVFNAASPFFILTLTVLDKWNDSDFSIILKANPALKQEIADLYEEWQPRLQSRCRVLLKITSDTNTSLRKYQIDSSIEQSGIS